MSEPHGDSIRRLLARHPDKQLQRVADRGGMTGKMARYAMSMRWAKRRKKKEL